LEKISTEILWQFWVFWLVSCIWKCEVPCRLRFLYLIVQFRNRAVLLWGFKSCSINHGVTWFFLWDKTSNCIHVAVQGECLWSTKGEMVMEVYVRCVIAMHYGWLGI
jgi:hypothetical protein